MNSELQAAKPLAVPSLCDQLPDLNWSDAVYCAYWLSVRRAHARELDNLARESSDPAPFIAIRDDLISHADRLLLQLKAALSQAHPAEARSCTP